MTFPASYGIAEITCDLGHQGCICWRRSI